MPIIWISVGIVYSVSVGGLGYLIFKYKRRAEFTEAAADELQAALNQSEKDLAESQENLGYLKKSIGVIVSRPQVAILTDEQLQAVASLTSHIVIAAIKGKENLN